MTVLFSPHHVTGEHKNKKENEKRLWLLYARACRQCQASEGLAAACQGTFGGTTCSRRSAARVSVSAGPSQLLHSAAELEATTGDVHVLSCCTLQQDVLLRVGHHLEDSGAEPTEGISRTERKKKKRSSRKCASSLRKHGGQRKETSRLIDNGATFLLSSLLLHPPLGGSAVCVDVVAVAYCNCHPVPGVSCQVISPGISMIMIMMIMISSTSLSQHLSLLLPL